MQDDLNINFEDLQKLNKKYSGTSKKRKELADLILEMKIKHNTIMQRIKNEMSSHVKVPTSEVAKKQVFD